MSVVVLDAFDVRRTGKGISRVLENIVPGLAAQSGPSHFVALTTAEGASVLEMLPPNCVHRVPDMIGSAWEQFGLPLFASRARANLIYTHRECAPQWGTPYVLHLPEVPSMRWSRQRPANHRGRARQRYEKAMFPRSVHRARAIISSTRTTVEELDRLSLLNGRDAVVIHLGIKDSFFRAPSTGNRGPYVFHLGSSDPRDNTLLVVRAHQLARDRFAQMPPLVVAGDLGAVRSEVYSLVSGKGADAAVELSGRVSDAELVDLYAGALVCVQPASDEGFGFQPLEAMAAGAPLVAYDTPAVRETVRDAAVFVQSLSTEPLAEALEKLVRHAGLRKKLAALGRERAEHFRWSKTVAEIREVLEKAVMS